MSVDDAVRAMCDRAFAKVLADDAVRDALEVKTVAFVAAADKLHNAVFADRPLYALSYLRIARTELAEVERLLRESAAVGEKAE